MVIRKIGPKDFQEVVPPEISRRLDTVRSMSEDVLRIIPEVGSQKTLHALHQLFLQATPENVEAVKKRGHKEYKADREEAISSLVDFVSQKTGMGFVKRMLLKSAVKRLIRKNPEEADFDPKLLSELLAAKTAEANPAGDVEMQERVDPKEVALAGLKAALKWVANQSRAGRESDEGIELRSMPMPLGAKIVLDRLEGKVSGPPTQKEKEWMLARVGGTGSDLLLSQKESLPAPIKSLLEPLGLDPLYENLAAYVLKNQYNKLPAMLKLVLETTGSGEAVVNTTLGLAMPTLKPKKKSKEPVVGLAPRAALRDTRRTTFKQAALDVQNELNQKKKNNLFSLGRLFRSAQILKKALLGPSVSVQDKAANEKAVGELVDFLLPEQGTFAIERKVHRFVLRKILERTIPNVLSGANMNPTVISELTQNHSASTGSTTAPLESEVSSLLAGMPEPIQGFFTRALQNPDQVPAQLVEILRSLSEQ